jgi:hypothetical protein
MRTIMLKAKEFLESKCFGEETAMEKRYAVVILLIIFVLPLGLAWTTGAVEEQYPIGHPDQGLPHPDFVLTPYHEDPSHVLNRVFRASFLVTTAPAEVGLALPREHRDPAEFFRTPWYFAVRPGTPADQKLFGGDTRHLSRDGFTSGEAKAFAEALAAMDGEVVRILKSRPELAVMFQHDLLRIAERLMETGRNPDLLKPIVAAIRGVALSSDQLSKLPSTYTLGFASKSILSDLPRDLLRIESPFDGRYVELLRNSTDVFNASKTLAWSRVFVAWPTSRKDLINFLSGRLKADRIEVPVGTTSVLVQGVVAVDDRGRPHATPIAFDVRVKWLANRDPMSVENRTTTRDGIQIQAYELRRMSLRQGDYGHLFRALHDGDQAMFRDYGALKHTTLAAQCAVCHRLHDVSDANLGGFITLDPSAEARPATTGLERLQLAEREVSQFLTKLRKAGGD